MRRLEGVLASKNETPDSIKKYGLIFDKIHIDGDNDSLDAQKNAEIAYLSEQGFVRNTDQRDTFGMLKHHMKIMSNPEIKIATALARAASAKVSSDSMWDLDEVQDLQIRILASSINIDSDDVDTVPICRLPIPDRVAGSGNNKNTVIKVSMEEFPTPGEMSSWEDIFAFRAEMHDKEWNFRRFLHSLASKNQTEAEIRDDIEWTLNEYTKAMKNSRLTARNSFFEVYVIPSIEFVEDVTKFNWSKIAKGALGVSKRQKELMGDEMKAPGRECAYVFEAQKRFGAPAR